MIKTCSVLFCENEATHKGQGFYSEGWDECFGYFYLCPVHLAALEESVEKYSDADYFAIPYEEQVIHCEYIAEWPQPINPVLEDD